MVWSRKTENRREVKIHTRGDIWAGLEGISFNAMQTFAKYDANTKLANTWHDVAEANCCECDETEVEGVKERPDMVDTIFESLLKLPQYRYKFLKMAKDSKKNIRYQSSQRVNRNAPKLKREKLKKVHNNNRIELFELSQTVA